MKSKILGTILIASFSTSAWAHVEPGVWKGKTNEGKECSFTAGATFYEGGTRHPLNERVKIMVDNSEYAVGHPATIDADKKSVQFIHEIFQAVVPIVSGAKALVIEVEHSEQNEGPTAFTLIENKWNTGEKTALRCVGLKHQN